MLLPCLSHERLTTSKHGKGASSCLRQGIGERAGTRERIAPAFSVAVCFIWFPWMRCYPEHPAPARNLLVVPVAESQASIGSMVAESAALVALAEQEKAVVVAQVAAPAEQVGVVRAVVAVQVAQA